MSKFNGVKTLTLEEHKAWVETTTQRLNAIYKQLCEYENLLDDEDHGDTIKVMELLDSVADLNNSARMIRLHGALMERKHGDLDQQMKLLEQSVEMLKLSEHKS